MPFLTLFWPFLSRFSTISSSCSIIQRANTIALLLSIKSVKRCLLPTFEPLFTRNTPKRGVFWPRSGPFGSFWGSRELIFTRRFRVRLFTLVSWEGGRKGVPKRGHLGSFGGQKGLFWPPFWGPYLRGLKKGLKKRPIGAKTCSARPKSWKRGSQKGVKTGLFEYFSQWDPKFTSNSRVINFSSCTQIHMGWLIASKTVFSLILTVGLLKRPWKRGQKGGQKPLNALKYTLFGGPFWRVQNRGHILTLFYIGKMAKWSKTAFLGVKNGRFWGHFPWGTQEMVILTLLFGTWYFLIGFWEVPLKTESEISCPK